MVHFLIIITRLANLSFDHAIFPMRFKTAQVTPLLKKHGLDKDDPINYRPISNLNTVSKILERLVLARIVPHVTASTNFDPMQSAYRKHHSTETALLKITNDIYEGFDNRQSTILVALDQSAAFDCIDHSTLIRRLHHTFVTGQALDWMTSYLQTRRSFVRLNNVSSVVSTVEHGVPQGSSLGPLLFSLYIAPLSTVFRSFGLTHHQYADDSQIYVSAMKNELMVKVDLLEQCTAGVHAWLLHNGLQLNPQKSEAIHFIAGKRGQQADDLETISISGAVIQSSPAVKSLGVTLDQQLTFDQHVNNVCKACYFHTRALRHVRPSLPDEVAKTVACSIVSSRLDYCNSLLEGMSESNFNKLQRVQNTLARVVLRRGKYDHTSSALAELHWLPIKQRVTFKLSTLAFNIKWNNQPSYLRELLCDYEPVRCLRSSTQELIRVDRSRTVFSSRAFRHSTAKTWNNLPDSIRACNSLSTFKSKLKTHLFRLLLTNWSLSSSAPTNSFATYGALQILLTYLLTYLLNSNGFLSV